MKLYGKNPVIERLKSKPKSIRKIYVQQGHVEGAYIRKKAKKWNIPVVMVPRSKMVKMGRSLNTQGILVDIEPFHYTPFDDLVELSRKKKLTLVFLDGLNDPQNLGGIIRSVACAGQFAIVLPTHGSVNVTETVLRVAAGADNYIAISLVSNLAQSIAKAKDEGFWIVGSVVEGGEALDQFEFRFPLALVIGSEQKGIRPIIQKQIDSLVTIPMAQPRLSMNVAHATAIFCYEIKKQKTKQKK